MADLLNIGISGLLAYQRGLSTTSHNISNSATEGYSRQRVELGTRPPQLMGSSYAGTGVNVMDVTRSYDAFIVQQVRGNTSSFSGMDVFHGLASRVDNLLADSNTGLSSSLQGFFDAMQEVANDPASQPGRQTLLSAGQALMERFHYLDKRLSELDTQINTSLRTGINDINSLAASIADFNKRIVEAKGASGGQGEPNDLLDQRDVAIGKLSRLVGVTTIEQDDGSMNVFIGTGQPLVVGYDARPLTVARNQYDPARYEVGQSVGGAVSIISGQISGGALAGALDFREQMLDPARNQLGRAATGLAETFNRQHELGMDLNGAPGTAFFTAAAPRVAPSSANTGTGAVSAAIADAGALTASDYKLMFNGGNSYTLTRLSDNQNFAINTGGGSPYTTEEMDGFALTITAGAAAGDTVLISPARDGARDIAVAINDTSKIAAAAPIRTQATLGNIGNATISAGTVNSPDDNVMIQFTAPGTFDVVDQTTGATLAQNVSYASGGNIGFNGWTVRISDGGSAPAAGDKFYIDRTVTTPDAANTGGAAIGPATVAAFDPDLTDTVTITFTSANQFTVTGATTGSPLVNVSYASGAPLSYNGWTVNISGTPATGDTFTIGANTNGVGDNRNALALGQLQNQSLLDGGASTYQDAYGQLVADVGSKTRTAELNRGAREGLLKESEAARDAVSGVNLDEEAANMLRYQQAYQAAAQVIRVADSLFQSLLSAVGR